eukprot:8745505-Karenia_brevis.AAC.1
MQPASAQRAGHASAGSSAGEQRGKTRAGSSDDVHLWNVWDGEISPRILASRCNKSASPDAGLQ